MSDNDFAFDDALDQLEEAREALLRVDPHPSEKPRLDRAYNMIRECQTVIRDLLRIDDTDPQQTNEE